MGVRDPRFTSKEHTEALSLRNVGALQSALGILKEPKVEKSLKQTEKMFKAIKESGNVVADVLGAFIGAGSAKDVFGDVVSSYADYLSDTFWSEIVSSIDYASITTAITDILGPIFSEIGIVIGDIIEAAPIGTSVGAALGYLIYGPIGALIGGMVGFGIEFLYNFLQDISGALGTISPAEAPHHPEALARYVSETGKFGTIWDKEYRDWYYSTYHGLGEPTGPTGPFEGVYLEETPIGGIQEFQRGTDYIKRGGMVRVERGEGITPSGYTGRTESLLMELLVETRKLRKDKAFRNMFKRR